MPDLTDDIDYWRLDHHQAAHHYERMCDYHNRRSQLLHARAAWHGFKAKTMGYAAVIYGMVALLSLWWWSTAYGIIGPALWLATR